MERQVSDSFCSTLWCILAFEQTHLCEFDRVKIFPELVQGSLLAGYGVMWTGSRTLAEVNKWERGLEPTETEVNTLFFYEYIYENIEAKICEI